MNPQLAKRLEPVIEKLQSWKGHLVEIHESISRVRNEEWGHDRHFATHSRIPMRLEYVGWAISGSRLGLDGTLAERLVSYEMTTDAMTAIEEADDNTIVFVEWFEKETERRSTIRRSA